MADQNNSTHDHEPEKVYLTDLRLVGESNHWRVQVLYTGRLGEGDAGKGEQPKSQDGNKPEKPASQPEEIRLSILIPAGDRSVVDLQVEAMERAIALLQTTANAARTAQANRRQSG